MRTVIAGAVFSEVRLGVHLAQHMQLEDPGSMTVGLTG